jgi:hypothetical protein
MLLKAMSGQRHFNAAGMDSSSTESSELGLRALALLLP